MDSKVHIGCFGVLAELLWREIGTATALFVSVDMVKEQGKGRCPIEL